jgi:predicted lipid-binding transport protein (Tim44 family)
MNSTWSKFASAFAIVLAIGMLAPEPAEARRGGSFGSRGMRTYQAPPPTRTAPTQAAPVQRSMTQPTAQGQQAGARPATPAAGAAAQPQRRGGFLGGLGGGILGGLLLGGLIGAMMGNGFGAGAGAFMTILLQLALVGGAVFLLMKLFRRRQQQQQPVAAGHAGWAEGASRFEPPARPRDTFAPTTPAYAASSQAASVADIDRDIQVNPSDRDAFERLLTEVQDAFGREDYSALRERTTPEIMSYLSEELSQNAVNGHRNEVSGTRLLEADVAEAWSEGDREYATAAMRYESVDVLRDRQTGAVVEGDASRPTETTELWTFVRTSGGAWKLSAIQQA